MKPPRLRIAVLAFLVGAAFAFWWFKTPAPLVGGGQNDGILAMWVKNRAYASVSRREEAGFARLTPENTNGWYSISREPIQTFDAYRSQNPTRPTSARRTLVLQPIGPMNAAQKQLLLDLKEFCAAFFQLPVRIEKPLPLPANGVKTRPKAPKNRGVGERQFDAGGILETVLAPRLPDDAAAYLGITMADLWAGDLSFVFGLGSFRERVGVYSLCRYFPAFSPPMSANQRKIGLCRACQVLDHESGHMFGLSHCVLYKCAMNGSNSLADSDASPLEFCPICRRKLKWNLNYDSAKRAADLRKFYRAHGL